MKNHNELLLRIIRRLIFFRSFGRMAYCLLLFVQCQPRVDADLSHKIRTQYC
jgi:hypothetical protein